MKLQAKPLCTVRQLVFALPLFLISINALAAGPATPGAGTILQQVNPATPPRPSPPPPFLVSSIQISGNTLFDTETLHALVAGAEGRILTRAQLNEYVNRITAYYRDHGYPQARAVIPPQTIHNGIVKIQISEGAHPNVSPSTAAPTPAFLVKTIRISGNTLFDSTTLHALVANAEGKMLTLSQLNELTARITDYYRSHGYPLARTIIPPQKIQNNTVDFKVIEARYDKIQLDNHSDVSSHLVKSTLSSLQSGQVIAQSSLDRSLLLLSDIPGVLASATLKPGAAVGTSDLVIETANGPFMTGNLALDNYGSRYTGRTRLNGTVNFINLLNHGDVLSLSVLSSGSGLRYGRLGYDYLLNGVGTHIGGSYSALHYALGDTYVSLNAHGSANVGSLWVKQVLYRGRSANLYGQLQYDRKNLNDLIDSSNTRTLRHLKNWSVSLQADTRDNLIAGGINTWSLSTTSGNVFFDDTLAQAYDALTAKTQGSFRKWNLSLARLQQLSRSIGLYLAFSEQGANTNLDPSEKMVAGGPYTVRAYEMGALSGDTGHFESAELRYGFSQSGSGQWQAIAFVDSEHIVVNRTPWTTGTNTATLSGAGLGLNWSSSNQWSARAYVAKRIGAVPTLIASTSSTRLWVEIGKGF